MQTTIFSLIDLLTNMSGATGSYETIQSELDALDEEIPKLKEDYAKLKETMTDDKYFDASEEIVDRNIEISVSKKLAQLEKKYSRIQNEIKSFSREEKRYSEIISSLNQKVINIKESSSLIGNRIESSNNENSKRIYNDISNFSNDKLDILINQLKEKNISLNEVRDKLENLIDEEEKIKAEIEKGAIRLLEVRASLSNKKAYIDQELKNTDEESLKKLDININRLENHKKELINSPILIANSAKENILSNNKDKALQELKRLLEHVLEIPYMDSEDKDELIAELTSLEQKQKELIALIENKKYNGSGYDLIEKRISHIKDLIDSENAEIEALKGQIANIDGNLVVNVSKSLEEAENESEKINKSIENYYSLITNDEMKSKVVQDNLKMSYDKKCNDLNNINLIIKKYEEELKRLIEKSNKIEKVKIVKIQNSIDEYNEEIKNLENLLKISSLTKDIIEQEKDKKELRKLVEQIKQIEKRLSYKKSANEIYDEIEMLLIGDISSENINTNIEVDNNVYMNNEIESDEINIDDDVDFDDNFDGYIDVSTSIDDETDNEQEKALKEAISIEESNEEPSQTNFDIHSFDDEVVKEYESEETGTINLNENNIDFGALDEKIDNEEEQNDEAIEEPSLDDYKDYINMIGATRYNEDKYNDDFFNVDSSDKEYNEVEPNELFKNIAENNEVTPVSEEVKPEEEFENSEEVEIEDSNISPIASEEPKDEQKETREYNFSELEDTDYFNLDDFLKSIEE